MCKMRTLKMGDMEYSKYFMITINLKIVNHYVVQLKFI